MVRHGLWAMEIQGLKAFRGSPQSTWVVSSWLSRQSARGRRRSLSANRCGSPEYSLLHALAERVVHIAPVLEDAAQDWLLDTLLDVP